MIALTIVGTPTAKEITFSWTNPTGTIGHQYLVDGKLVSNDNSATKEKITFGIHDTAEHSYEVVAVGTLASGSAQWPAVTPPPPPPPGFVLKGVWDSPSADSENYGADWTNELAPAGFNSLFAPPWAPYLQAVKATGGQAWVQIEPSLSDADAVAAAKTAWAVTGSVWGFYIYDEPGSSDVAFLKARSALLKAACPGCITITSQYDPGTLAELAGSVDVLAIDYYPCRYSNPIDMATVQKCVAACESKNSRYVIVVQAFTDGTTDYRLPTPAELQTQITYAKTTKSEGFYVYAWGVTGAPLAQQLQNHPELLAVIKAA